MKRFIVMILLLMSVGCQAKTDYKETLVADTKALANSPITYLCSNYKKLYRYYLDPSLHLRESGETYSVVDYDDDLIVINVNIDQIINDSNYHIFRRDYGKDLLTIEAYDKYVDNQGNKQDYTLLAYQEDDLVYLVLRDHKLIISSLVAESDVLVVANKMMNILKSASVDTEKVMEAYAGLVTSEYTKKPTDLFKSLLPSNTTLDDIIKQNQD
jgi:hypothetical protein